MQTMAYSNCWVIVLISEESPLEEKMQEEETSRLLFEMFTVQMLEKISVEQTLKLVWYDAEGKPHVKAVLHTFAGI